MGRSASRSDPKGGRTTLILRHRSQPETIHNKKEAEGSVLGFKQPLNLTNFAPQNAPYLREGKLSAINN